MRKLNESGEDGNISTPAGIPWGEVNNCPIIPLRAQMIIPSSLFSTFSSLIITYLNFEIIYLLSKIKGLHALQFWARGKG